MDSSSVKVVIGEERPYLFLRNCLVVNVNL